MASQIRSILDQDIATKNEGRAAQHVKQEIGKFQGVFDIDKKGEPITRWSNLLKEKVPNIYIPADDASYEESGKTINANNVDTRIKLEKEIQSLRETIKNFDKDPNYGKSDRNIKKARQELSPRFFSNIFEDRVSTKNIRKKLRSTISEKINEKNEIIKKVKNSLRQKDLKLIADLAYSGDINSIEKLDNLLNELHYKKALLENFKKQKDILEENKNSSTSRVYRKNAAKNIAEIEGLITSAGKEHEKLNKELQDKIKSAIRVADLGFNLQIALYRLSQDFDIEALSAEDKAEEKKHSARPPLIDPEIAKNIKKIDALQDFFALHLGEELTKENLEDAIKNSNYTFLEVCDAEITSFLKEEPQKMLVGEFRFIVKELFKMDSHHEQVANILQQGNKDQSIRLSNNNDSEILTETTEEMLKFLKGCNFQDTGEGVMSSTSPVIDKVFNIPNPDLFDKLKKATRQNTIGQNTIELTTGGDTISLKCTISTQKKFELKLTYNEDSLKLPINVDKEGKVTNNEDSLKLPINVDKEGKVTILSYAKTSDIKKLIDNRAYLGIDIQINDVNIEPRDLKNILESFCQERLSQTPSPSTSSSSLAPMPVVLDSKSSSSSYISI
ncbi:hypothetical protein N9O56_03010 [Rickettsiales bacterium]|nr:hypothetical protein [Rickettsiales bacterium]